MSQSGQTLRSNSAFGLTFVRCTPDSDQTFCNAANAAKCHKETFRLSEMPISPLALRLITAALLELCEDLF